MIPGFQSIGSLGLDKVDLFFTCTPDGTLTYLSNTSQALLGFSPEELLGSNWSSYLNAPTEASYGEDADGCRTSVVRFPFMHANGEARVLEAVTFRKSPDGEIQGIAVDITQAARTTENLRNVGEDIRRRQHGAQVEARLLQTQFERNSALQRCIAIDRDTYVFRWNPDGTLTYVNDAYCRTFCMSEFDALVLSAWELIHEEDKASMQQTITELSPRDPQRSSEHRYRLASGRVIWVRRTDHAQFDHQARLVGYHTVGREITGDKQVEQALEEQKYRTSNLINKCVHDVKQSLASSDNFANAAQLLLAQSDTENVKLTEFLGKIRDANRRATELLTEFGDFSRPIELSLANCQLDELIKQSLTMLNARAVEQHIRVLVPTGTGPIEIIADPMHLMRVFTNLLANAIDSLMANPEADRMLSIQLVKSPGYVTIIVADNGPGISAASGAALFQGYPSSKSGTGHGFGLAICYEIVSLHQGTIWHETVEPRGAAFHVRLPTYG